MHQEAPYELFIGDGYGASGFPRRPGPGGKDGICFTNGQDPAVGDGDFMCILTKIFNGVAKSVEGLLDIGAPVHPVKPVFEILPSSGCPEVEKGFREREPAVIEKEDKERKEFPFEFITQDKDRNEEASGGFADSAVRSQAAAGNDAVHMHIITQLLIPSVEHLDNAGHGPEEPGIGGKFQKRLGTASVEKAV